jgi:hypothetical protein
MEIAIFIIFLIIIIAIIGGITSSNSRAVTGPPVAGPRADTARISKAPEISLPTKPAKANPDFIPINNRAGVSRPPETAFKVKLPETFTGGKTKTDPAAPCFITGQPISSCACAECKRWRAKRGN